MIDIIGVPFDLCGKRFGCRLGPAAIRFAGVVETLAALGRDVRDSGDLVVREECTVDGGLRNFAPLLAAVTEVHRKVLASLKSERLPLILGGEHTIAIGSISAALAHFGDELAVLWVDAHADINTPSTSITGNLHGMPIAALMGLASGIRGHADREWRSLLKLGSAARLRPGNMAWFGLRDLDPAEQDAVRQNTMGLVITMHDIDRYGLVSQLERFDHWIRASGAKRLWISFDVDAMDPVIAPGTGTTVRGGLSFREGHLMAELLHEMLHAADCPYTLAGIDFVEVSPLHDSQNETAKVSVEWLGSLFGKTILGKR